MIVECTGCGEDCSHSYGTHKGYPYHFGCLPTSTKRRLPRHDEPTDAEIARSQSLIAAILGPEEIEKLREEELP